MTCGFKICFSGWASGIEDIEITDVKSMSPADIRGLSTTDIVSKLNSGEWSVSLSECLQACRKSEVDIFDIEA